MSAGKYVISLILGNREGAKHYVIVSYTEEGSYFVVLVSTYVDQGPNLTMYRRSPNMWIYYYS